MNSQQCPLESQEQQHVVVWCKWHKYKNDYIGRFLFAIPNGGTRRKINKGLSLEAVRLKKEGVSAGVPDLMLAIPSNGYHGLFIEMKRKIKSLSKVSNEQKEWHERLSSQGYKVVVAFGADAAIKAICEYLNIKCDL